ncbi:pyridine nucleotide-disulfide oxidoreductase [Nocardioides guangzhouensis]|uniref:Pyridine nucleotide-disulfide oxidoreductase n=1 Tax=Nocardioides guangzhouensis TaxID=2497878 RepID=A0A4Q4ZGG0_9ACTN|nr:NAD(P)/FAD-dependent oxidoreductase [Nocardioides guangzhouensis]RYP86835.1 pyridine nucleotide-disulfide oxidoreductase [Nocardioides guangzhouensis]
MNTVDTVVIGAGHAGLAVSHLLGRAGRDHVVVERGAVAQSWRTRWDSLTLLTPRWMSRLPGWRYRGPGQEGFMPAAELVGHLEAYAASSAAPLALGREVLEVAPAGEGYRVTTTDGTWSARHVVVATGPGSRAVLPPAIHALHPGVRRVPALDYRNPESLPSGAVLVVGASASGVQIADELARSGRRVVLAVGRHTRVPRRYRGMDLSWWLDRSGRLARTIDTVADPVAARRETSLQLVGREPGDPRGTSLGLDTLQDVGVELVGRVRGADGHRIDLADDLPVSVAAAQRQLDDLLDAIDADVDASGLTREVDPADRPEPVRLGPARTSLDLGVEGFGSVVLATGLRPHHPWLRVPVTDLDGTIRQCRGRTPAAGLYVVGQRFQHRRDSATLDGARHDARDVVSHLVAGDTAAVAALEMR